MHDCGSILDSIANGTSCFHYFLHGASLHRHLCIQVNDFYTLYKRPCTWETEAGLCVSYGLQTYQSSCI